MKMYVKSGNFKLKLWMPRFLLKSNLIINILNKNICKNLGKEQTSENKRLLKIMMLEIYPELKKYKGLELLTAKNGEDSVRIII